MENMVSRKELEENMNKSVEKKDIANFIEENLIIKNIQKIIEDSLSKTDFDILISKYVSKKEIDNIFDEYVSKDEFKELEKKVNSIDIKTLVGEYMEDIISKEDNIELTDENDRPKTKFEEIIEPSVARIIHRVLRYDQYEHTEKKEDNENLNVDYNDVYTVNEGDCDINKIVISESNYNPLYIDEKKSDKKTVLNKEEEEEKNEDVLVDLGSVYNDSEIALNYTNEMRSEKIKNKRWSKFGDGVEKGSVIDLFLDKKNKKIYIVGHFKHVNRVPIENIAVYDIYDKQWKHVGEGIPQVATSITVDEENEIVYVGGVFSKVGKGKLEINANNVAGYDVKNNEWFNLDDGLNRECSSIIYDNISKNLYTGGTFTESGKNKIKYLGVYNTIKKEWRNLEGGSLNGACRALLKNEDELFVGGLFTHIDDLHVSYIANYNITKNVWKSLSGGVQGHCNALAYDAKSKVLFVGGTFTNVGSNENSINANHIARYDFKNEKWDNMDGGVNNIVHSIYYDNINECVYVGGTFTRSFEDDVCLNCIAKYDLKLNKWKPLENEHKKNESHQEEVGLNGPCKMISFDSKSLFIAGSFQTAGNITANSIARYALER